MTLFVTVLHVLVCIFLIVIVLLQRGKGAEVGAVFGGGGGGTMFGARGAGNFLTRLTTASAATFMVTSLVLALFAQQSAESSLFDEEPAAVEESPFAESGPAAETSDSPFAEVPQATGDGGASDSPFAEVPQPAAEAPAAEAEATAEGAAADAPGLAPAPAEGAEERARE